jgi:hypothetical protein
MASRPVAFEGVNLGLLLALALLSFAAGSLLLGPGGARIDTARKSLHEQQQRLEAWQRQRGDVKPVSEAERSAWEQRYAQLTRFAAPEPDDDAALAAWVAARLSAPSVRDLQVSRAHSGNEERRHPDPLHARAPDGSASWEIHAVPVRVGFDARYADVSRLLRGLEAESSPLRVERMDMRRLYPDVRVELDVTLWIRREVDS